MLSFKSQPLNYSAQAEAELRRLAPFARANGGCGDEAGVMLWLADQIRDAVHFVMPEDGRIFDDRFKGIQGAEAHLPFSSITLEYQAMQDPGLSTEGKPLYKATKRVLLAMEMSAESLLDLAKKHFFKNIPLPAKYSSQLLAAFPDGVIFVTGVFYVSLEETPVWSPCYAAWLLPVKGWDQLDASKAIKPLRSHDRDSIAELGVSGRPFPVFWRAWTEMMDRMGSEMTDRYIANEIGAEAFVVLELIEALSCRNVRISTLQSNKPAVNARRVRDGKLPLYETKILTVDISSRKEKERGPLENARASPGEHLRCGHIQSYHTREGIVNLWKQPITVSAGNPRKVDKIYKIKR